MSTLLPGNIVYGGEMPSRESSNYRSLGHFILEKFKDFGDRMLLVRRQIINLLNTFSNFQFQIVMKKCAKLSLDAFVDQWCHGRRIQCPSTPTFDTGNG